MSLDLSRCPASQIKIALAFVSMEICVRTITIYIGCLWLSTSLFAQGPESSQVEVVTRNTYQSSHANLRWSVQHFRELYPTQAVYRGSAPVSPLPKRDVDVLGIGLALKDDESVSVAEALKELEVDACVVLHRGELIAEHYFHGMQAHTPHFLASVNKSIVASVIATLLADGSLKEVDLVERHVPQLNGTPYAGATIRQVLDMLSAIHYTYDGEESTFKTHETSILPEAAHLKVPIGERNFILSLQSDLQYKHGERMLYKESDPGVLVWVAEQVTQKRFAELAQERLWSRLGAEYPLEVVCDSLGHWTFHNSASAVDLARWGQMLLQNGYFNEQQILPRSFVQDIRSQGSVERLRNSPLTGDLFPEGIGYRSFFYRDTVGHDAIAAVGAYGQMVYISPFHETVIVLLSSTDSWDGRLAAGQSFEDVFAEDVTVERMRWNLCRQLCERLSANE